MFHFETKEKTILEVFNSIGKITGINQSEDLLYKL
jgi:hypothetical protein